MKHITTRRKTWKKLLQESSMPILLPVAHDALTARLIELAGFDAYQIGGYALSGATHAIPDVDLEKFGEKKFTVESIITASPLPFMIDIDDGYGDVKNGQSRNIFIWVPQLPSWKTSNRQKNAGT